MQRSLGVIVMVMLLLTRVGIGQTVGSPYEVATWSGFRSAAISYTFDDNCSYQLTKAVPMFNAFGFKLTLFVVPAWGPNWAGLVKADSAGHEIASHTVDHANLANLTKAQQEPELKNSQDQINAHIPGKKTVTFAYPNCGVGNDTLVAKYYFAARGCQGFIEGRTPGNFMNISSLICGAQGQVQTSADFRARADDAAKSKGWCVYLLHGLDDDGGYSALPSDTLRKSLEYLTMNPDKFWVAPFGTVAKYVKERNAISLTEVVAQGDSLIVEFIDTLDNALFNYPLTVRRPLPSGWSSAVVKQAGLPVPSSIVTVNTVQYVVFDVVPDADIVLSKSEATDVGETALGTPASFVLHQNYPNPFNPATTISFSLPVRSVVSLRIFDMTGKEVATIASGELPAGTHTRQWNADGIPSGVYFTRLQTGTFSDTKKLLLIR